MHLEAPVRGRTPDPSLTAGVVDLVGAWGFSSRLRLPRAANKSGSEAIHSTGLHDILNSGFGEACDEDRPASQCGCAARRSRSVTWSSTSCSGIFLSYLVRDLHFALV